MKENGHNKIEIEPIKPLHKADIAEIRIREYFRTMNFKPGDLLPKEQELADALDVSRNVVREALSRLRMLGIIESKKKRGMILTSPDLLTGFKRVMDPSILSEDSLLDLFEFRLTLEIGMADLLFLHKTDQDIEDLERIVKKENKPAETSYSLEHEIEFHGKLYQITRNSTLLRFQKLLLPVFQFVLRKEEKTGREIITCGSTTHHDLVTELKMGSASTFRKAMQIHLKPHFDMLVEKYD